jgi:hypothetical protein
LMVEVEADGESPMSREFRRLLAAESVCGRPACQAAGDEVLDDGAVCACCVYEVRREGGVSCRWNGSRDGGIEVAGLKAPKGEWEEY